MSSLRNAVKRVTHKERSQPRGRSHLGLLEKKKDYKVRSRDFHDKQDRLHSMRRKAEMRNPDEFYFSMKNSQVKDGVHRKTEEARQKELEDTIGADAVKVMKGQDLSYIRMQVQKDAKKIERLQASLHFLGGGATEEGGRMDSIKKRKHTVFVNSSEKAENFDVAEHFGTAPTMAGRAFNRPRIEDLRAALSAGGEDENDEEQRPPSVKELAKKAKKARREAKKVARARAAAYGEMEARSERMTKLRLAEAHLNTERLVAGKGQKRKIKGAEDGQPAMYKWRRKRAK